MMDLAREAVEQIVKETNNPGDEKDGSNAEDLL